MWSFITGLGSKAVGFLLPFKMQIIIGAAAALSVVIGVHLWGDHRLQKKYDQSIAEKAVLVQNAAQALHTIEKNKVAYEQCLAVNEANAIQLSNQIEKGKDAAARITLLEAETRHVNDDIVRETNEQRGKDNDCRTVDDPLPDRVLVGVFDD